MTDAGGLTFILRLLGGVHKYSPYMRSDLAAGEHYLPTHPFRREFPGATVLIGSPGLTASIAGFVYHLARRVGEGLKLAGLTRYRVSSGTGSQTFNLFYEAVFAPGTDRPEWTEAVLVGGCTNYSGEGGAGMQEMESLFGLLADLYGVRVDDYILPADAARRVDAMLHALDRD